MKNILCIFFVLSIVLGCARAGERARYINITQITPDDCLYNHKENFFKCSDEDHERYLKENQLTDKEIEDMGAIIFREDFLYGLVIMRLYDCATKPQSETVICTYPFAANMITSASVSHDIKESRENGKFIYKISPKKK